MINKHFKLSKAVLLIQIHSVFDIRFILHKINCMHYLRNNKFRYHFGTKEIAIDQFNRILLNLEVVVYWKVYIWYFYCL